MCHPVYLFPTGSSNDPDEISIGTDDSAGDADEVKAINVENAFMDEKKAAVFALRAICKHTGTAFLPYLYQGCRHTVTYLVDCRILSHVFNMPQVG